MVAGSLFIFFLYEKKTNQKKRTPATRPIGFVHSSQIKQVAGDSPSMAKRRSNGHPWRMAAPPFALLNSASVHRCARGPKSAAP